MPRRFAKRPVRVARCRRRRSSTRIGRGPLSLRPHVRDHCVIDIFSGRPYCLRISKVDSLLYAGNNLDKAQDIFAKAIKAPATDQADRSGSGHACFGSGHGGLLTPRTAEPKVLACRAWPGYRRAVPKNSSAVFWRTGPGGFTPCCRRGCISPSSYCPNKYGGAAAAGLQCGAGRHLIWKPPPAQAYLMQTSGGTVTHEATG